MRDPTAEPTGEDREEPSPPYRLPPVERYVSLAVLVAIFFFGAGRPVWSNPFDVDAAVWLSYAPIPIVVLALLAWHRRLGLVAWFLNTLELTLVKFAITYSIAIVLWATSGGPPPVADYEPKMHLDPSAISKPAPEPAPPATPWPDAKRTPVTGQVRDHDGHAVAGALVYVTQGLDDLIFEPPANALRIEADERGFGSALMVAREHQVIEARSGDGRLHNLVASPERDAPFNVPLLADGSWQQVTPPPGGSILRIKCVIHAPNESEAHLLVLHHPHHALTDDEGKFDLGRLPARRVVVGVRTAALGAEAAANVTKEVDLVAGDALELELRFPDPSD